MTTECSSPATGLTDDLVVEILSRLPFRSVCRCKCVSRAWRDLISQPEHRGKLPKTLPGFFHNQDHQMAIHVADDLPLTHIPGTPHPPISLDFLPHTHIGIMDYCNGLLLGRGWGNPATGFESEYVVCNPATEEWIALPQSARQDELMEASLCFDPAVSPHFHVVELWLENDLHYASYITGLEVYSSQTRTWAPKENGWEISNENREDPYTRLVNNPPTTVFLRGCLHLLSYRPDVAVVDMEGKTWRNIPIPGRYETDNDTHYGFIQQSQGCLHYAAYEKDKENGVIVRLVIYVLQDYGSQDWLVKHSVEDPDVVTGFHWWVAMHPKYDVVFYTALKGRDKTLMSYDMDHRRVQVICKLELDNRFNYVPYEPLYSELQALQM